MTTKRPLWAETSELMRNYYDTKWGFPNMMIANYLRC